MFPGISVLNLTLITRLLNKLHTIYRNYYDCYIRDFERDTFDYISKFKTIKAICHGLLNNTNYKFKFTTCR